MQPTSPRRAGGRSSASGVSSAPIGVPLIAMFASRRVRFAASALDLPALGGASVTPANLFLDVPAAPPRLDARRHHGSRGGNRPRASRCFSSSCSSFGSSDRRSLLPRLFEGVVMVFSLSRCARQ